MMRIALAMLTALVLAAPALAQTLRPGDERPELPAPAPGPDEEPGELELPPLPPPAELDLGAELAVGVERFQVVGSTVFDEEQLAAVLSPWLGRTIRSEELLSARDAVTRLYRDAGYATSGAIVPDQDVVDGTVRIQVVESALTEVSVRGARRFRRGYLEQRLLRAGRAPLKVDRVERALRILQRDPWVRRVDARLEPGDRFGESRLVLAVEEAPQWRVQAAVGNDHSPRVGSTGPTIETQLANLMGLSDVWSGKAELTEGLRDFEARFQVPLTPWDTLLGLRFRDTHTEIVERPFDDLDIEGDSRTYAVSLSQPLYRGEADEVWLDLVGARRETESKVSGTDFCFEVSGPDCDHLKLSILRGAAQWTRRTRKDVLTLRSQLSFGIDALGADVDGVGDEPDATFVAWLSQAQWIHVLPESLLGSHMLLRGDLQLANEALLSIEQFAMGGLRSVRGYRENQLVRDSGFFVSGELRIPVWRDSLRRHVLEVVPFMDFAQGWNEAGGRDEEKLWGIGAGLRFMPREGVLGEVYWGGKLEHQRDPNRVLQDDGVYLRISFDAPTLL